MKGVLASTALASLPLSGHADLFDVFSDVCLAPILAGQPADLAGLRQVELEAYGLRGGDGDYTTVFSTPTDTFYVRLADLEDIQCTAHHFTYEDAEMGLAAFDEVAHRFDLTRRADCDQTASSGQQIVYYEFQEGYSVTTVWLNTNDKARVTWMGLRHAEDGSDCS